MTISAGALDPTDPAAFRRTLGHLPTGVTVVTAHDGVDPVAMVVGSVFSVSLDPPLIGLCAGRDSTTWPAIARAEGFVVNVLAADQAETCTRCAGPGPDRLTGVAWEASPHSGAPRLAGAIAHLDCTVTATWPGGDHQVVLASVRDMSLPRGEAAPLVFFRGRLGSGPT